jgi:hypothetical protein
MCLYHEAAGKLAASFFVLYVAFSDNYGFLERTVAALIRESSDSHRGGAESAENR